MNNQDFLCFIRAASLPEFDSSYITLSTVRSRPPTFLSWLLKQLRSIYRYCYVRLHDLILSSLCGYLTLNEKLYVAVHENNLYRAHQLLSRGASPSFLPIDCKSIFKHLIKNNSQKRHYCAESSLFSAILAHDSILYMAVSHNNLRLVKELINFHDYGRAGQHTEVVSLCLAVKRGYFNIVRCLIDFGRINPNDNVQTDCKHCKTRPDNVQCYHFPLYHACLENHFEIVKYLVDSKNCDINQLTTTFETCLHGAVLGAINNRFDSSMNNQQRFNIVQYLLSKSNRNPDQGLNPLCISLAYDYIYDYPNLLLEHNCNINRLGWDLHEPIHGNLKRKYLLKYALDHPLNICLRRLCQAKKSTTVASHSFYIRHANGLIREDSNLYAMYETGSAYPFLLAIHTGDQLIVQKMLQVAKLQIKLDIIEPLVHACTKSYHSIVQLLVDFGFNPNGVMMNGDYTRISKVYLDNIDSSNLSQVLNHYCEIPVTLPTIRHYSSSQADNNGLCGYMDIDQEITPFLALSHMSTWIFHPDQYDATVKTIENLFSHTPIDFSVEANRLAFYYALFNDHMPIVYFCLANLCPITLLHQTIEFTNAPLKNSFSYTLFHVISVCCRLATDDRVKRALLDGYRKSIIRLYANDPSSSMVNVTAYLKLWINDEDFASDPVLFEHLMSLPMIHDITVLYCSKRLHSIFRENYDRVINRRQHLKPIYTLKELCRLKIRHLGQAYCCRRQTNMLAIVPQLACLPKLLVAYLFYTRIQSNSLIDHLLEKELWNNIQWM